MNNDLTIDTLSFKLQYSDKTGSKRIDTSRGVTLPTTMSIAHQQIKDSNTGLPARRSVLRFDRNQSLDEVDGITVIGPISAYVVVQIPTGSGVQSSDVLAVIQHLISTLQEDDSGLDLMDEIFINQEQ
jgi:hypothetical protein